MAKERTDAELEAAAKRFEERDPADGKWDDTTDLRRIAEAVDEINRLEARVREMVTLARADGRSWGQIGIALGTSRQAARERFGEKADS